jgi:UDPglucose 6-dehydrogenase
MMLTKVGIIGIGFVGDAIQESFAKRGLELFPYDKYKEIGSYEKIILEAQIVFLALPTLYKDSEIGYDKSSLHEVCNRLKESEFSGLVINKSTVEPGITQQLADQYGLKLVHNPEFLTARTARTDFENQSHVILGATTLVSDAELRQLVEFYGIHYPNAEISLCSSEESESMKIMVNSFYAIKVQVFNEFYLYCQKKGVDYPTVRTLMLKNGWINPMHTMVPGPDGKLSYGGACFPKDTSALLADMIRVSSPHAVLQAVKEERELMRPDA